MQISATAVISINCKIIAKNTLTLFLYPGLLYLPFDTVLVRVWFVTQHPVCADPA